jgi:hypothetical protein
MLRNAHHAAMVSRQPIQVVFDPAGIVEAGNGAASSARRYDLRLQNVKLVSMTGAPVVTFYPSGRSASGTTITLANARGDQWRITVGLTGRVVLH